jgi:hypothetical protein
VKIHLPHRALSIPSTPVSHSETSLSVSTSSTEDIGLNVQVVRPSTLSPTIPSFSIDTTSAKGQPHPLVADNGKHY